jgi:hypothetical protein
VCPELGTGECALNKLENNPAHSSWYQSMSDTSVKTDKTLAPAKTKRKMRPGGGKSKGSGFESQIAKKLSTALDPLKFIRTQGSGARVGGKNFETIGKMFGADALKLFVGDVVPVNEQESGCVFKFSVECKFYKTPDSFTSLISGTANIFKWMKESVEDAKKTGKVPLLIFKWNNTPVFVAALHGHSIAVPVTTISNSESEIDVFYLDELLKDKSVWFS